MWTGLTHLAEAAVIAGLTSLAIIDPGADGGIVPVPNMVDVAMPGGATLGVAVHEVTFAQWKLCFDDGGCGHLPVPGLAPLPGAIPVTGVNHLDVRQYLAWINRRTGRSFRLASQAEWQHLSRDMPRTVQVSEFTDPRLFWAADYGSMPAVDPALKTSGSFGLSGDGIADLGGNVWEWTSTCFAKAIGDDRCPAYKIEGLHETQLSIFIRNPAQGGCAVGVPPPHVGFRLVEDES
jgi:formylglycine-generating enzyme required for sulfatase activity